MKPSRVLLLGIQGSSEALQILRVHTNGSSTRTVNICNEKERYRKSYGQNEQEEIAAPMSDIANQEITKDGDDNQKYPCGTGDAVPPGVYPCEFNTSFMPETTRAPT